MEKKQEMENLESKLFEDVEFEVLEDREEFGSGRCNVGSNNEA